MVLGINLIFFGVLVNEGDSFVLDMVIIVIVLGKVNMYYIFCNIFWLVFYLYCNEFI